LLFFVCYSLNMYFYADKRYNLSNNYVDVNY